jgi:hypothetical protein
MNPAPSYCHSCRNVTPTAFIRLRGGLIGNCCAVCRACRKGRPYISYQEFERYHDAREGRGVGHEREIP